MGEKRKTSDGDQNILTLLRLSREVGALFLQTSDGQQALGASDSGYASLQRRLTILDRVTHTHSVWLLLPLSQQGANRILQGQPPGTFLVRRSSSLQRKVICLRASRDAAAPVREFPIKESQCTFSLEGSSLSFADLFRLVAFCCFSRDVLPVTLRLPEPITSAVTFSDLQEVSEMAAGFWDVQLLNSRQSSLSPSGTAIPYRLRPHAQRAVCPAGVQAFSLQTRPLSELDCFQANGALCFFNPLFAKVHEPSGGGSCPDGLEVGGEGEGRSVQNCKRNASQTGPAPDGPPTPPPPTAEQTPPQVVGPHSMPGKVSWTNTPKEKMEGRERSASLLPCLSSSDNICSSDPPQKRFSISSPIPILRPSQSFPPHQAKTFQPSSLEEDDSEKTAPRSKDSCRSSVLRTDLLSLDRGALEGSAGGEARLSDMSFSTDSSDSLSFSQSSSFFIPFLHEPSPPTMADFDTHLPLSLPPPHLPNCSMDEDEEDDEGEPEYGVSLDSDSDLTMGRAGRSPKQIPSGGALVLQKALRGRLSKMSSVFHSLLTPQKKAVHRVLELSLDSTSYFGSLVQDFLSFMVDGGGAQAWQSFSSGLELLQTVRQFITQMKMYLRQSSEMQPPMESLIPEDHIDHILERAMHKCVLKPLRPTISAALQDFQVRSGAWQQLKENLSLAKAQPPQEMGVVDMCPPDAVAIEKIRTKLLNMCALYSPEEKVRVLLSVCKLIYTLMEDAAGRLCGADDFLPMLTYVLAQCDLPELENQVLYMMELLDPLLLHGEGGYYLTSTYGALSLIKNFQEEQAARVLSSETKDTLKQWHRRRTTQRPSIEDFQNYLRVALQELDSGCTAKTLQVRPNATVRDVCRLCALKFKVLNPESYGLFLVMGGSCQQLAPDTHPQKLKAELHSNPSTAPFHFVFRRVSITDQQPSPPCPRLQAPPPCSAQFKESAPT
ncbi:ras and Rab interactor 2 isoform X2 [Oryzias latipes]